MFAAPGPAGQRVAAAVAEDAVVRGSAGAVDIRGAQQRQVLDGPDGVNRVGEAEVDERLHRVDYRTAARRLRADEPFVPGRNRDLRAVSRQFSGRVGRGRHQHLSDRRHGTAAENPRIIRAF